eukprot:CAMPEP_0183817524 /NCGR_PEP_ID=MMETSP0803_2-20130417/60499_1 /TAXON_ID=195967 /ORGANISM="Crustomastix stigmata, Strain CCMP3273" /LENGTH=44 /DNA_ID= /DNA_START= /DNA_END= /DNA_ORIENTATION=
MNMSTSHSQMKLVSTAEVSVLKAQQFDFLQAHPKLADQHYLRPG